jgi:N-acyl amino acid synthase FeeM
VKLAESPISHERPYSVPIETSEKLPFVVRMVETPQDLRKAVEIRSSAFARHIPSFGEALRDPEADDHRRDVLLLIAERKTDRKVIGSMRMQPNTYRPLRVEGEATLPSTYRGRRLIEFMRLGVENGNAGRMVMAALAKAGYELCHATRFDFILAAGRRSTAEIYRSMRFDDVFEGETVELSYAQNMQHSIFALPIFEADRRWRTARHALYGFMARTEHPDIRVDFRRAFEVFGRP